MTLQRGDVVLVRFPFSSGSGSKVRPALVIDVGSPEARQSGLLKDSVITCENLATVDMGLVLRKVGTFPAATMQQLDGCLKASLALP